MTIIVANDLPESVRGILKRWFIEPRANIFVGTVNRKTREKTLEFIQRHAGTAGLLVISSNNTCQGFTIETIGNTKRRHVELSGLLLIAESWLDPSQIPF